MAIMTATSTRDAITAHCTRRPRIDARGDRALRSAAFGAPAASLKPPTAEADATPAASLRPPTAEADATPAASLRPPTGEADATLRYRGEAACTSERRRSSRIRTKAARDATPTATTVAWPA